MQTSLQIVHDQWLSGFFNFDVFNLNIKNPESFRREELLLAFGEIANRGPVFIYARVQVEALNCIHSLEDLGFRVVDTNAVFSKPIDKDKPVSSIADIRFARMEDEDDVGQIAETSFKYSRFHLDPAIENRISNSIKAQWARNYFAGDRGDQMIVLEREGRVRGFLQLLFDGDALIIDLIAVVEADRGKNIAGKMIDFAERNLDGFRDIRVGTQVANIASIRLYEKLGFRIVDVKYLLHYHRR